MLIKIREKSGGWVVKSLLGLLAVAFALFFGFGDFSRLGGRGGQQAAVLRADGFATALDRIYGVAKNIDANTLSLQYFETLKELGAGASTKFIFPMEFTNMLAPFTKMVGNLAKENSDEG